MSSPHPEKKKIEVAQALLIMGSTELASQATGVPYETVYRWRKQPDFQELMDEMRQEEELKLGAVLAKKVDKILALVEDRLDHGDFVVTKTGQVLRKPVNLKDAWKVGNEMIDIRRKATEVKTSTSQEAVGEVLKTLAKEFANMAKNEIKDDPGTNSGTDPQTQTS